jgi:cytoskeleton protein RodZ
MSSIGETLRRERIRRNLDLVEISGELKISSRFLEAIEEERFDRLPAGVFAKSFVRQYATLLGLDGDELATEVEQVLAPPPPLDANSPDVAPIPEIHVPRVEQWETVSDRRSRDWSSALPAAALVVVVMLVCSGVYAFWQRARHPMTTTAQTTPALTSAQPPVTAPAPQVQAPAAEQAAAEPPKPEAQPQTQPGAPINPEPATVAQTPKPTPAVPDQPKPTPPANNEAARIANPNAPVRVQLTADEPVWVLARADGKYIFSGTLDTNQTRSLEANEAVTLRLGNAGGVHITLNGKPLEAVGPKGQVREIQLTSGGFHIVAAPKPSLPLDNPI